jgi:hypothetical protein
MPFGIYVVAFIYIILSINTTMEMIMLGKKYLLLILSCFLSHVILLLWYRALMVCGLNVTMLSVDITV